jgi:molecular chaperone GrpE
MTDEEFADGEAEAAAGADASTAGDGASTADGATADTEGLVARVAAHDEELAGEVAALRDRADDLETDLADAEDEIEALTDRLTRTKADFKNYKDRAERKRQEVEQRATEDLVADLLDVRDNLARALDQDEDADIREGVEATLRSFDRTLESEGVERIDPDPGTDLDPQRHEALQRVEADQHEGTVVDVYRPGYEMAGKVLRAAQVTVCDG